MHKKTIDRKTRINDFLITAELI